MFNTLASAWQNRKSKSLTEQKAAALEAAWEADKRGSDHRPHLAKLYSLQLQEIQRAGMDDINHVRIRACGPGGHFCEKCREANEKVYALATEREEGHLPIEGCTCSGIDTASTGFCLCYYEVVFDDEL